jgi:predicted XRE-type DNA-binding protein
MNKSRIGSDFDDFLREEKLLEGVEAAAVKRVLSFQVEQEMKQRQFSKAEMARRMKTSRAAVERLLDPQNTSVTLATLGRAAAALGKNIRLEFTEPRRSRSGKLR